MPSIIADKLIQRGIESLPQLSIISDSIAQSYHLFLGDLVRRQMRRNPTQLISVLIENQSPDSLFRHLNLDCSHKENAVIAPRLDNLARERISRQMNHNSIQSTDKNASQKIIWFDCLNPLFISNGTSTVLSWLGELMREWPGIKFIVCIHRDQFLSEKDRHVAMQTLEYMAQFSVTIHPPSHLFDVASDEHSNFLKINSQSATRCLLKLKLKRRGAKILEETVMLNSKDDKNESRYEDASRELEKSPSETQQEENVDPMANLSFKLGLTEEQKQARAEVVLPYMRAQNASDSTVKQPTIFYAPEEADDFDDEDPDADLEI